MQQQARLSLAKTRFGHSVLCAVFFVLAMFALTIPARADATSPVQDDLLRLTNSVRQEHSLRELRRDAGLERIAVQRARILLHRESITHLTVGNETLLKRFDRLGENLAAGQRFSGDVVQAWMDSPHHRQNLLNRTFNRAGIAAVRGAFQGHPTTIVVQIMGRGKTPSAQARTFLNRR